MRCKDGDHRAVAHGQARPEQRRVTRRWLEPLLARAVATLTIATLIACGGSKDAASGPGSDAQPGNGAVDAEVARGGRLYDKFWSELGIDAPSDDHPLWERRPDLESNHRAGADTWRCKECHGWDYQGVEGAYGGGSHRTGFPGILGSTRSIEAIVDLLMGAVGTEPSAHGYGSIDGVTPGDLRALAAFVRRGALDTALVIDGAGHFTGAVPAGNGLYHQGVGDIEGCADCHGEDGLSVPGEDIDFSDFVGKVARENPAEFQHKVRFGQPGTEMPAYATGGLTVDALAGLGAFAQTLPTAP